MIKYITVEIKMCVFKTKFASVNEANEWIYKNLNLKRFLDFYWFYTSRSKSIKYCFKNKNDALRFKLMLQ